MTDSVANFADTDLRFQVLALSRGGMRLVGIADRHTGWIRITDCTSDPDIVAKINKHVEHDFHRDSVEFSNATPITSEDITPAEDVKR